MDEENLFRRVDQAERKLVKEIGEAEQACLVPIDAHRATVRKRAQETVEDTPALREVRETIERLQLRLELLRNIKMNWHGFQESLTRRGMKMRINQYAHLEHLISFLETGHGIAVADEDEVHEEISPERAMMTHEIQPTGAGKTGAFAIDIALMDVTSLTLVPFDPLLDQTKKDMMKIGSIPEDQIGIVGGGSKEIGSKHTIATYAGHAAQMRKGGEYARFMKTQCKLVICDEVHHQALGDRMQESIEQIDVVSNDIPSKEEQEMFDAERDVISHLTEQIGVKSLKIGFTATPRGYKKNVRHFFPHCLGRVYHKEMVDAGLIVPYKIIQCDGSVFAGEFNDYINQEEEAKILQREGIYGKLVGEYADVLATYRKRQKTSQDMPMRGMAFCTNHAECEKFAEEAQAHGLRCRIVTGREARGRAGQAVINAAVDALIANDIDLIITVEKLATGFNREEINAIISARITSAAKTVQYIGRGARSYTDNENRVKTCCLVFETNWTLKNNAKKGRKPLRIADALEFNGEDPEAICSMADGSVLLYDKKYQLNEDGTVDVDGVLGVVLGLYADQLGISKSTLEKKKKSEKIIPIAHIQMGGWKTAVYEKAKVDMWDCVLSASRITTEEELNDKGILFLDGIPAIGCHKYSEINRLTYDTLMAAIQAAGIQPIGYAKSTKVIPVYPKERVDQLQCLKTAREAEAYMLNKDGITTIGDTEAIHINLYASFIKIKAQTLKDAIIEAEMKAIGKARYKKFIFPVYNKSEVDALQCVKEAMSRANDTISDKGTVTHSGILCIGVNRYSKARGIKEYRIQQDITDANLPIVGYARRGSRTVAVYEKTKVDELPCFHRAIVDDNGLVTIKGVVCIAVKKYAEKNLTIHHQTLKKIINEAALKSFGEAKRDRATVPVYRKDEVDTILQQQAQA